MSSDSPSGVADLVAREAIRTNLFRYARGVDRRDWDMVRDSTSATSDVVVDVTFGGRYVDVVECRDGEWRVAKRAVTFEWISAAPAPEAELDSTFLISRRDRTDALYMQAEAARQLSSELVMRTS